MKDFIGKIKQEIGKQDGSGLGLAIANCIITAHKGSIKAIQNSPKGTIFIIKLPK